jgi:hypothetical protein
MTLRIRCLATSTIPNLTRSGMFSDAHDALFRGAG